MAKDTIVLIGVTDTIKALKAFDKDAVKSFNKVINSELKIAKNDAQGFVQAKPPLSGWSTKPAVKPRTRGGAGWPAWDQSVIREGISSSKSEGKVRKDYTTSVGALKNKSAAGVIYELAGRENKGSGKNNFISSLEKRESQASRLVWKSVDKNKDRFINNVERAFKDAQAALQRKLDTRRV